MCYQWFRQGLTCSFVPMKVENLIHCLTKIWTSDSLKRSVLQPLIPRFITYFHPSKQLLKRIVFDDRVAYKRMSFKGFDSARQFCCIFACSFKISEIIRTAIKTPFDSYGRNYVRVGLLAQSKLSLPSKQVSVHFINPHLSGEMALYTGLLVEPWTSAFFHRIGIGRQLRCFHIVLATQMLLNAHHHAPSVLPRIEWLQPY